MKRILIIGLVLSLIACAEKADETEPKKTPENTTTMNQETATKNKATVKEFFRLLEEENIPAFVDLFAEIGEQVNPYASGIFPAGAKGKEALLAYWEPVPANFDGMKFPIEELYAMEDPHLIYVKYQGEIKLKNDAGYYTNNYYSTFRFDDQGKILE